MLCVAAVAFACGPRAHNDASAPRKDSVLVAQSAGTTAALAIQQGAPVMTSKAQTPRIAAQLYVRTSESAIRFALHVSNNTKKNVELTFPTGQTHDFVILDSVGREVWRWGTGRMFTQNLRNKLLGGGETLEVEEMMERKPLPPGRYTAKGFLKSANYPLVQEAAFTVSATIIASR